MKRLLVRLSIALLTFALGVAVQSFRYSRPAKSDIIAAPTDQTLTKAPTARPPLPPLPQPPPPALVETGKKENSDLSIVFDNDYSDSVVIHHVKLHKNRPSVIELELTDSLYDHEVALNFRDDSAQYQVLQKYRTSMTVSAEGPHLDLVDWRHFDSPWISLKSIGPKRFRMLADEEMDEEKFPPTSQSEIAKEVRRRMAKEWPEIVDLGKSCSGPNDGPCHVSISSMHLRIQKLVGGTWTDIGTVEFQIPMGC